MRFGLIGYGAIGKLRAQAVQQTPGAELVLVAELVAERRAEAARSGLSVVAKLEELLADPRIDAVILSTPPNLHRAHVEAALRAGKHVLCEKPLAPTPADCAAMVAAAERSGRTLGTGFNYRFYPAVARARELVAQGKIGELVHVKSFAGHPGGPEFTHQWVHDPSIMGGGALMDNGIHLADLTLHFLGRVSESSGQASEAVWHFEGSEDNGFVLMRTPEGRIGALHASWTEWHGYHFDMGLYGTEGCIYLRYPPMLTILYDRPAGAARRGRRQLFLFPAFQIRERLRSYRWTIVQSFIAEQADFMQRCAGRPGVGATGEDGLRAVELVACAYRKSEPAPGVAPAQIPAREMA